MKKLKSQFCVLAIIVCALVSVSCSNQKQSKEYTTADEPSQEDLIKRGEYMVSVMGCNDCHSPKKMGPNGPEIIPELRLSGFPGDRPIIQFKDTLIKSGFAIFYPDLTAAAGPWGVSFSGNLTPDETGIGNWTESQFKKAITEGKFKGMDNGRSLLPPMPWQEFKNLKDQDVKAIYLYLKSINPVKNQVPPPVAPDAM